MYLQGPEFSHEYCTQARDGLSIERKEGGKRWREGERERWGRKQEKGERKEEEMTKGINHKAKKEKREEERENNRRKGGLEKGMEGKILEEKKARRYEILSLRS